MHVSKNVVIDILISGNLPMAEKKRAKNDQQGCAMPRSSKEGVLERFATLATCWSGSSSAFAIAVAVIVIWVISGPMFGYSDTWQLVINTGTTIVTFLMVFLIQRAQNKESLALQLKLNEIVAAASGASNRLINIEDLSEAEIRLLHDHYRKLSALAAEEMELTKSHSIEEAEGRHASKSSARDHEEAKA